MTAPIANPNAPLNQAAKELTELQIQVAQQLIVKYKITDGAFAAAILTALATNTQTIKS